MQKSKFSKDYNDLRIDIEAEPDSRSPETFKCTMKNPAAPKHLREYLGSEKYANLGKINENDEIEHTGGKISVHVKAKDVTYNDFAQQGPLFPSMQIVIKGDNLHAPLIERVVELPLDIQDGRLDGHLVITSDDSRSWNFPRFNGRVAVKDAQFHFWDSPDEITQSQMDLIFEGDRVYLHKAKGYFGAVPLKVTGDLDLNPLYGEYRISATVPGVEGNALRATLGVRPTPFSVAGAVSGTMHVSGPLEKPVFSGHAHIVRPDHEMFENAEDTPARKVLEETEGAVGAYDRVPFREAGLVFSVNTANDTMTLHAVHAHLVDGGQLHGAGVMNISAAAEMDPKALDIVVRGSDIHQEALIKRFVPDITLPVELSRGISSGTVLMSGAHLSPVINANFSTTSGAAGSATFQRESTFLDVSSPHFDATGTIFLNPPSFEASRSAKTQTEASKLAKPDVTGCSIGITMNGLDMVPFLSDDDSVRNLSKNAGEPVKLRLNGQVKVEGDVRKGDHLLSGIMGPSGLSKKEQPWMFKGSIDLENVRMNQMKLYRDLKGTLEVSEDKISAHGKGMRPDEVLDIDIDIPSLLNQLQSSSESHYEGRMRGTNQAANANLRCGRLQASGSINEDGTEMDFRIANLKLDELEFASLRGDLQEASCSLNFKAQTGRGRAIITAPKYSGIQGENLSGGFRWDKDVFRLEKLVLQQKQSRYEVQGEYVLPPNFSMPMSTGDILKNGPIDPKLDDASGRWRIRIDAPYAEIQDVTPLARVLQTANDQFPKDYERAKSAFMRALTSASLRLQDLNEDLDVLMNDSSLSTKGPLGKDSATNRELNLRFSALQTCQGFWSGSVQAFGGGGGATSCDFDVRGQNWQWGNANLDSLVAKGSGHSEEGILLQEVCFHYVLMFKVEPFILPWYGCLQFVLKSGDAKLLIRGSLFNQDQDATLLLTDFPVSTLRPIFQAIPALKNATPAPSSGGKDGSILPLGVIADAVNKFTYPAHKTAESSSPINGQLFVSGSLNGSIESPKGGINLRVYDAAIGSTKLSKAQAFVDLKEGMMLDFGVDFVPLDGQRSSGHISASGTFPLATVLDGNAGTSSKQSQKNEMDVQISVKDGGMAVLTAVTPNLTWKQGNADLSAHITGTVSQPNIAGNFSVSKALFDCPFLKYPLNVMAADVECEDNEITVRGVDARAGRKGRIRVRGSLPFYHEGSNQVQKSRITLDLYGLEMKARNAYTGQLDALLTVRESIDKPIIGGSIRFSRGSLLLNPQGQDINSPSQEFDSNENVANLPLNQSVSKVFKLLTKGDSDLTSKFENAVRNEMEAVEVAVQDSGGSNAVLDGLAIQFGPDLRAVYPLVMNFAIKGDLVASGPAHPDSVEVTGTLKIPSGEVNLLAAQFELDREHENSVVFGPSVAQSKSDESTNRNVPSGIDPLVDIVMNSGDLRISVTGKASEWADHLVMQSTGRGGSGMEAGEQLDALEAAKVLETKLKAALLADNGQIALTKLAGSTMATFMPKIETQGSVGETRWRLVSAPSVPGLLDPRETTASNVLDFLSLGAEVEVSFGEKLQAAMVRKLRESDIMTKWTMNYNLSSKLRMQFNISSVPPYPKTLTFQYSSEGNNN